MGWTSFAHRGQDTISLLKREMECVNEAGSWKMLDYAQRGNVVYAVIERRPTEVAREDQTYVPDHDGVYRFIGVFLTSRKNGEFAYKDMCESMGPYEAFCPARLVKLASPLRDESGYAGAWRKRCAENAAKRTEVAKKQAKLADGVTIKLAEPVSFRDGYKGDTFTVCSIPHRGKKRHVLLAPNGSLYRIPNIGTREYSIVAKAA